MSFKNFTAFSEALAALREQLETNALLVRVVNRISNLITNAQSVPGQYTAKYNSVQLLQYDSEGQLQDVTPESQLSIPEAVLKQAVADITSNQQLAESDLKVFGNVATAIQSEVTSFNPTSDTVDEKSDFTFISSNLLSGRVMKDGTLDAVRLTPINKPNVTLERDYVEARFVSQETGEEYPIYLTLQGISWISHDYSTIELTDKNSDGSKHIRMAIHVTPEFTPPIIGTTWKKCAEIVSGEFKHYDLQLRLTSDDSEGFVGDDNIISFSTTDSTILFTGNSRVFGIYRGVNENLVGVKISKDSNSVTSLLYPKSELEALKAALS